MAMKADYKRTDRYRTALEAMRRLLQNQTRGMMVRDGSAELIRDFNPAELRADVGILERAAGLDPGSPEMARLARRHPYLFEGDDRRQPILRFGAEG